MACSFMLGKYEREREEAQALMNKPNHSFGRTIMMKSLLRFAALVVLFAAGLIALSYAQPINPPTFDQLRYRYIGPVGNRVSAIAGVPGQPNIYYAGAASGGIFKTTDGGAHWQPIFDDQVVSSIGALAV